MTGVYVLCPDCDIVIVFVPGILAYAHDESLMSSIRRQKNSHKNAAHAKELSA